MVNRAIYEILRLFTHQDWIRLGIRKRILDFIAKPENVGAYEFETDFFNLKYRGNLNQYIDCVVYFYGAYEKQELFLIRDLMHNRVNPISLDIGANVGQHCIFMATFFDQVHAFEPFDKVRRQLYEKISINEIDNIVVHDLGLSDESGELDYYPPKGFNTGTGSFLASKRFDSEYAVEKLIVVRGDEYISLLNLERLDFIKIDVEGFEKKVLCGLEKTLERFRPILLVEYSELTKASFSNSAEFTSIFPSNYCVLKVTKNHAHHLVLNSPSYALKPFDFNKPGGNVCCIPGELTNEKQIQGLIGCKLEGLT